MEPLERRVLPLFPLPNLVLFPGIVLPLRIFEPRYKVLVADVLRGDGCLGIVALRPGWEAEYERSPETYEVGCKGIILQCEEAEHGQFNILLQGTRRFRIDREVEGKVYREAEIELLPEPSLEAGTEQGSRLRQDLVNRISGVDSGPPLMEWELIRKLVELDESLFINAISYLSPFNTSCKQFLLEAEGISQRYEKYLRLTEFEPPVERIRRRACGSSGAEMIH